MRRETLVLFFGLWACTGSAVAQTRAGGEFLVNTSTTGGQFYSSVGRDARGNFVVVWANAGTYEVQAQRYDRAGRRVGAEFVVNPPGGIQQFPAVAMNARGEFLVAWGHDDGSAPPDVFAQLYDAAGTRVGSPFLLNDYTTDIQTVPNVAADGRGNFVVAWWSFGQDGSGVGMAGRRVSRQGTLLGSEFVANTYTTGTQYLGNVAAGPNGEFVVAWSSNPAVEGYGFSVNAQRFDATGARLGDNFQVNTYTTGVEAAPGVAVAPDGSFVIAFVSTRSNSGDVYAQRYTAGGDRLGDNFQVNSYTTGIQIYAHLASDSAGNFVVAWYDTGADGSPGGVSARRFRADGTPRGGDFIVNTYTTGNQLPNKVAASVAGDAVGNVVVTWAGDVGQGGFADVLGQRYGGLHPLALRFEDGGNDVWEPGETATMQPFWFNASGATQTPGGGLANLTGPAGATYTIVDGTGVYPALPDDSGASCTDCYAVSVSAPATRPATHWDASVIETLTPDAEGQAKQWLLHVGHSFTDVPDTNAFYRYVEILLHKGITAGCATTAYCPGDSTAREQMAVFVLAAKEGAGFAPRACTTPLFSDVPASSPFCPFIEELARRGVVGGCGGGRYCPADAVTREQMAVFTLRTLDPALSPPLCTTPVFADVPASSPFCRWIEELARRHVVSGCGMGNYCPTSPVTREQMGVFISATFGFVLYGV